MTTGVLIRRLSSDPLLEETACVILDEFHERSLEMDLALGMLQRIRSTLRPEFQLIIMSATLETNELSRLIPDAVVIESEGRAFDVDIRYQERFTRERIEHQIAGQLPGAIHSTDGDVLVFLPGVGEIHRTAEQIGNFAKRESIRVCKLYGDWLRRIKMRFSNRPASARSCWQPMSLRLQSPFQMSPPSSTAVWLESWNLTHRWDSPAFSCNQFQKRPPTSELDVRDEHSRAFGFRLWPKAMHRRPARSNRAGDPRARISPALLALSVWGEFDVLDFSLGHPPESERDRIGTSTAAPSSEPSMPTGVPLRRASGWRNCLCTRDWRRCC